MKEMKIEQIIDSNGRAVYRITDTLGETVTLKPNEAVLVLDFLYRNLGELTSLVNELASERGTGE